MIENKQSVSFFVRLAAGIYDALLMLGVWFTVGSLGLIIQYTQLQVILALGHHGWDCHW